MESGHSTLFVIYCLVSNRVELFSGSRIWIPGNFEIPLSSVNNAVSSGYFYTGINNTNAELDFVSRSILVWYGKCDTLYYDVCVFSGSLLLYR